MAEKIIKQIKILYPNLPRGVIVYFKNDPNYPYLTKEWGNTSKQASVILNGSDALQLLYKDPTLRVFYEDLGGIPEHLYQEKVYEMVANLYFQPKINGLEQK